jgi:predicted Zn finger-like uncharacterized protein
MPIDAQCGSCMARYRVVDSAAGRRVKCRRCGNFIDLPGNAAPADPFAALAELEKTARPVAASPNSALIQYRAVMSTVAPLASEPSVKHGTAIGDLRRSGTVPQDPEDSSRRRGGGNSHFGRIAMIAMLVAVPLLVGSYFSLIISGIAVIVFLIGGIGMFFGGVIWSLFAGFKTDLSERLMCIFIPFYSWYFFYIHFDELKDPFFTMIFGIVYLGLIFVTGMVAASGPAAADLIARGNAAANAGQTRTNDASTPGQAPVAGDGRNGSVRLEVHVDGAPGNAAALERKIATQIRATFRERGIAIDDTASVRAVASITKVGTKRIPFRSSAAGSGKGQTTQIEMDLLEDRLDFIGSRGQVLSFNHDRVSPYGGLVFGERGEDSQSAFNRQQWEFAADTFKPVNFPAELSNSH